MTRDEIISGIFIGLFVLLAVIIVWYALQRTGEAYEEVEQEVPNELLQHIAEYRTYMINQWICLLAFWFNIQADKAQTKLLCPAPNQNAVYFFHENIEIYAFFSWNDNTMEVKTSVFDDEDGYIAHDKVFSISNGSLETDKLFDFILQAKKEHYDYYDLSADDVIAITKQLKFIPKDNNTDAVKLQYFDTMADLMILMRQKKNRNNRKLLKTYMGLVHFLWQTYGEDFLKYLGMTEEEFVGIQNHQNDDKIKEGCHQNDGEHSDEEKKNNENIKGNE